mmetsp:Transcript_30678/g.74749  ORF Transcript_30678/g.74749 Transcript_30678/m.74749 type:complete len:205 (-) Transcript_30678:1156-1770(-)
MHLLHAACALGLINNLSDVFNDQVVFFDIVLAEKAETPLRRRLYHMRGPLSIPEAVVLAAILRAACRLVALVSHRAVVAGTILANGFVSLAVLLAVAYRFLSLAVATGWLLERGDQVSVLVYLLVLCRASSKGLLLPQFVDFEFQLFGQPEILPLLLYSPHARLQGALVQELGHLILVLLGIRSLRSLHEVSWEDPVLYVVAVD